MCSDIKQTNLYMQCMIICKLHVQYYIVITHHKNAAAVFMMSDNNFNTACMHNLATFYHAYSCIQY